MGKIIRNGVVFSGSGGGSNDYTGTSAEVTAAIANGEIKNGMTVNITDDDDTETTLYNDIKGYIDNKMPGTFIKTFFLSGVKQVRINALQPYSSFFVFGQGVTVGQFCYTGFFTNTAQGDAVSFTEIAKQSGIIGMSSTATGVTFKIESSSGSAGDWRVTVICSCDFDVVGIS